MGKMFFNILATFAEFEVDLLRMRVAQQVLPVRIAVSAVPAITTFGAVIAARAGQPCAAAAVGGRINR
jgi:hypothetical protein